MNTQQQVNNLMDYMAKHDCSLLQAQIALTSKFTDQMDTATKLIRMAFQQDGKLTRNSKVVA